ncbi:MAG: HAMP domain-containing protein [Zoogloeaceae bacterium]|nr:HAMP domain-containing protein [Zoogloeaceae bacterium]
MISRIPSRLAGTSLALRIFLVLLLGVLVAAVLTFGLAQNDRRQVIEHFHGREAVQRIADMLRLLSSLPQDERSKAMADFNPAEWRLDQPTACVGQPAPHLAQGLSERLSGKLRINAAMRVLPAGRMQNMPPPIHPARQPIVAVSGNFADGQPFCIVHQGQRRIPPQIEQWRFPVSLAIFVALIGVVSWFAVRLAMRPLKRMADAAEAFGHDIQQAPLDTRGPAEVRQAAQAFNVMQERVRTAMAERTQILAAVTHDLKTPLTRMRLRLETCTDDNLRQKFSSDIAAMQRLVDEGLELARSLESGEATVCVDLNALLSSIAEDAADAGQAVSYTGAGNIVARCQPNALQRAVENLIDNALKYGEAAEIQLESSETSAIIRIKDHGPGIPEDRLKDVLQPFVRLEVSRSRESGGTGLGLTITNNLLAIQGGRLELINRPEGGLEARVTLPLEGLKRS